jgi:hypothetical protein
VLVGNAFRRAGDRKSRAVGIELAQLIRRCMPPAACNFLAGTKSRRASIRTLAYAGDGELTLGDGHRFHSREETGYPQTRIAKSLSASKPTSSDEPG